MLSLDVGWALRVEAGRGYLSCGVWWVGEVAIHWERASRWFRPEWRDGELSGHFGRLEFFFCPHSKLQRLEANRAAAREGAEELWETSEPAESQLEGSAV